MIPAECRVRPLDDPGCPGVPAGCRGLAVILAAMLSVETGRAHCVTQDEVMFYDTDRRYRVAIS